MYTYKAEAAVNGFFLGTLGPLFLCVFIDQEADGLAVQLIISCVLCVTLFLMLYLYRRNGKFKRTWRHYGLPKFRGAPREVIHDLFAIWSVIGFFIVFLLNGILLENHTLFLPLFLSFIAWTTIHLVAHYRRR